MRKVLTVRKGIFESSLKAASFGTAGTGALCCSIAVNEDLAESAIVGTAVPIENEFLSERREATD